MKKVKNYCLIAALALVMLPVTAFARPAFIANVNIGLIVTSTVPALNERDDDGKRVRPRNIVFENEWTTPKGEFFETGAKMQRSRISNREILQWLVNEGVIDAVRGHRIAAEGERLVVVRPNGDIELIDCYIGFACMGGPVQAVPIGTAADLPIAPVGAVVFDEKSKETLTSLGYVGSFSSNERCNARAWFDVDNKVAEGVGILSRGQSLRFNEPDTVDIDSASASGAGSFQYRFRGGTLDTISGWFVDRNEECDEFLADLGDPNCRSLVEGRIRISRGRSYGQIGSDK